MIRIAFIGAGAVGGYFGGLMSEYYQHSKEIQIYFICRETTSKYIGANGLKLETTHGDYLIKPRLFEMGSDHSLKFDYIFCCTKSFDLLESLIPLKGNINKDSVIIPLLNGVDNYHKIKSVFPDSTVWDACVYLVSRIIGPGQIKETGGIQLLYFGSRENESPRLLELERILCKAGIKAEYSENILSTIWEKFLFISSIATITSYLDKSIGEILNNEEYNSMFHSLLTELNSLAIAKKIKLSEGILNSIYTKMKKLPFEATSSMHSDFKKGAQTELESLTGVVVRMAEECNLELPLYKRFYGELKLKQLK
jgi:2-dehydropantoate 2-reductase